jgi:hypothetical protein
MHAMTHSSGTGPAPQSRRSLPAAGSPILEMARRAAEYRAAGRRIIDLNSANRTSLHPPTRSPPLKKPLPARWATPLPTGYRNCATPHGARSNETEG